MDLETSRMIKPYLQNEETKVIEKAYEEMEIVQLSLLQITNGGIIHPVFIKRFFQPGG